MWQISPPKITNSPYARPMLTLSHHVTQQSAAAALRMCWDSLTVAERLKAGLTMTRAQITNINKEHAIGRVPTFTLEDVSQSGCRVLLSVFGDSSAIVWRCDAPNDVDRSYDEFRALPVVLRLTNRVRPQVGNALLIRPRTGGTNSLSLMLSTTDKPDNSTSLTYSGFAYQCDVDDDMRNTLRSQLMREACAWAASLDDMPAVHVPPEGSPPDGFVDPHTISNCKLPVGTKIPYVVPPFVEWRWITLDEADELREFAKEISCWFYFKLNAAVDIEIDTALIPQKNKASPRFKAVVTELPVGCENHTMFREKCDNALRSIMASDIAPPGAFKLIGQDLQFYKGRKHWLSRLQIARCFYNHKASPRTAHEIVQLHAKFDVFWNGID